MGAVVYYRIALIATALALCVVILGAYVRLSHAGLGCPDWPGCYGQMAVPQEPGAVAAANEAYPERPLHEAKAWKEMIHRYVAGTLGLLVLALAIGAWRWRGNRDDHPGLGLPTFLLGLIVFQALLGMWTVTLLLQPVIVMGHLLGGMTTLALLFWLGLRTARRLQLAPQDAAGPVRVLALTALAVVAVQIALGGWTSANYAALACYDFPTCHGQWWPPTDFGEAFTLWHELGVDYEGGVLDTTARVTIHLTHRIGALITALIVAALAIALLRKAAPLARALGALVLLILCAQIGLGIANVVEGLPLAVATTHNAVGALLLLTLVLVNHAVRPS